MKKALLVAALMLLAATAFGVLGQVVASFASPSTYPIALARATNDAYLWVYCNASPYNIYRMNAETGAVLETIVSPRGSSTRGLTYEYGGYVYIGDSTTDYIYRYNTAIGSLYSSYAAGHDMYGGVALRATGDGGSGATQIWTDDTSPQCIYLNNLTNGSIVSSFVPSASVYDLAWDWRNNLVWGGVSGVMYGYNPSGSLVSTFAAPAANPLGATYYGSYLWIGTTVSPNYIYKVHCPQGNVNIAPSSLGRVKAIYK